MFSGGPTGRGRLSRESKIIVDSDYSKPNLQSRIALGPENLVGKFKAENLGFSDHFFPITWKKVMKWCSAIRWIWVRDLSQSRIIPALGSRRTFCPITQSRKSRFFRSLFSDHLEKSHEVVQRDSMDSGSGFESKPNRTRAPTIW